MFFTAKKRLIIKEQAKYYSIFRRDRDTDKKYIKKVRCE